MKKAFSLLELIFTISIIAIIATVAIPKFSNTLEKANIVKLKSDISAIREGLTRYKTNFILKGEDNFEQENLDKDELLFKKVIDYNIISSKSGGSWEKISNNSYNAYVNSTDFVEFIYDKDNFTFDCNIKKNIYCEKLTQ